jgi:hypothetical protein
MHPMLRIVAILAATGAGCLATQRAPLEDGGFDAGFDGGSECPAPDNPTTVSPGAIDFGAVVVESVVSQYVTIFNCAAWDETVTPSLTGPQASSFNINKTAPFTVHIGETVTVTVSYAPLAPSTGDTADLQFLFSAGAPMGVTLHGVAVQSGLKVTPIFLNFAFVQSGNIMTLPLHLSNIGNQSVTVLSATIANAGNPPAFSIATGSWTAGNLAPGASEDITVAFAPTVAEMYSGELDIQPSGSTNVVPVALTGTSVDDQPCHYDITPTTVNFGQTSPRTIESGGFTIRDLGPNECLVTGLNLSATTQNVFTLRSGPVVSQRLSAPGTAGQYPTFLQVNVDFTPEQTGTYSGSVEFTISDPAAPQQAVNLTGVAGTSCFVVQPAQLNFRTVGGSFGQFCATETSQFVGVNGCAHPVTIDSATIVGSSAFVFTATSTPQLVPAGGSSTPFVVYLEPLSAGTFDANVLLQTDLQPTAFGVGLSGSAVDGTTTTDRFIGHTPQLDVLWIMDTDDSASERNIVASQAPTFIDALGQKSLDYQIGVTSDDWCSGGIQGTSENGRLLPCPGCKIDGQSPVIITPQDANAAADLQTLMEIGANTGASISNACTPDEQFFSAAYEATVATDNQAWNAPLIRPDAYLAIITVNGDDTDDNSWTQTALWFANEFLSIKGADNPGLFSWSYINPSELGSTGGHQSFTGLPDRIQTMLTSVGGVAVDTTQPNWTEAVTDLWNIVLASSTTFPLSGTPDPTSIAVYLDGPPPGETAPGQTAGVQIFATNNSNGSSNWSYDTASNSLVVNNANLTLSSSDTLYVEYTLTCP